jgi:hypothetical protein
VEPTASNAPGIGNKLAIASTDCAYKNIKRNLKKTTLELNIF